jgi:hypothetical protein
MHKSQCRNHAKQSSTSPRSTVDRAALIQGPVTLGATTSDSRIGAIIAVVTSKPVTALQLLDDLFQSMESMGRILLAFHKGSMQSTKNHLEPNFYGTSGRSSRGQQAHSRREESPIIVEDGETRDEGESRQNGQTRTLIPSFRMNTSRNTAVLGRSRPY